jgi:hypothetical protein
MLTIKIVRPNGSEYIEEATSVFLNTPEQSPNINQSVTYFKEGKAYDVFEGKIYVMNNNGKTVADYFLAPLNV